VNPLFFFVGREAELRALVDNPSVKPLDHQLREAACRGVEPAVYHPDLGQPDDLALALCTDCPARLACLALALRAEDPDMRSGWYGGLAPRDRDAIATDFSLEKPEPPPVPDRIAQAAQLRAAGWTIDAIATELGCSRRTVQRHLRRSAA
jgi:AraC-like DNA-binding protein